jgi:hypothetical protein
MKKVKSRQNKIKILWRKKKVWLIKKNKKLNPNFKIPYLTSLMKQIINNELIFIFLNI